MQLQPRTPPPNIMTNSPVLSIPWCISPYNNGCKKTKDKKPHMHSISPWITLKLWGAIHTALQCALHTALQYAAQEYAESGLGLLRRLQEVGCKVLCRQSLQVQDRMGKGVLLLKRCDVVRCNVLVILWTSSMQTREGAFLRAEMCWPDLLVSLPSFATDFNIVSLEEEGFWISAKVGFWATTHPISAKEPRYSGRESGLLQLTHKCHLLFLTGPTHCYNNSKPHLRREAGKMVMTKTKSMFNAINYNNDIM